MAREHGASLVLVHAIERQPGPVKRLTLSKGRDPRARAETEFRKLREGLQGIDLQIEIAAEPAYQLVPRLAASLQADLIVLGLHLARRVLDSVRLTTLERIVSAAHCPVLIAHDPAIKPYHKVLGAITFAPASAHALKVAAALAQKAEFHAIHALQLPFSAKLPSVDVMKSPEMTEAQMLRQVFMQFGGLPAGLAMPEIVPGGVHEVLQFRINELQPDLVVIGSHSGRDTAMLGAYARDLMRAPPTDMLVAKPD